MAQPPRPPGPTAREQARKRALLAQLEQLGWYCRGSLLHVMNRCGTPGCRCKADPPELHGPYWQWTRKVEGKTVTRRLSDAEAQRLRRWLANAKRLDRIVAELDALSDAVTNRMLAAAAAARKTPVS
jgi:hypothetical protein